MLTRLRLVFLMLLFIAVQPTSHAAAQDKTPETEQAVAAVRHTHVRLIPEKTQVGPNETITIAIEQVIEEGWHTYWVNAGDSGEAMRMKWSVPNGVTMGETKWPVPERIDIGPLTSFGYEDRAIVLQDLTMPPAMDEMPIELLVETELLVCKEICIPEYDTLTLMLNDGSDEDNRAFIEHVMDALPKPAAGTPTYKVVDGDFVVTFDSLSIADASDSESADIFPYEWGLIENTAKTRRVDGIAGKFSYHKEYGGRALSDVGAVRGLLVYGDGKAYDFVAQPAGGGKIAAAKDAAKKAGGLHGSLGGGFVGAVVFALLGGLILNLMPCVFPVLSMKVLSLSRLSEKEQSHARQYGLAYAAGILVCFALVAGLLIALRAAGEQIGWGFQLQNPQVVFVLAALLFVIGLSLSGLFEFGAAFAGIGGRLAGRGGLAGSFFTGMLAAIVATPCTAPFMGAAMGYALTQGPIAAIAVFLALGLGLALPYLALTFVPAFRNALPKPGQWMVTLKEFLAFPMYLSAAWLVWVYGQQTGALGVLYALSALICIAFALWLLRLAAHGSEKGRTALRVFAALIALSALSFGLSPQDMPEMMPAGEEVQVSVDGMAQPYTPATFEAALAGDAPLFVNMTAAWCITCKVNERVALEVEDTKTLFAQHGVTYFKGDWTNQNPDITKFLDSYGRNGVPLYVYVGPRDKETGDRPGAVVLPQLLTPGIIKDLFETKTDQTKTKTEKED